jgi:cell division protein FtsL
MVRSATTLVVLVVASALGVVATQHRSRQIFIELEREQARAQQLEVEWGQLQIEQSTWAAHQRVEQIARDKLGMRPTAPDQVIVVEAGG